MFEKVVDPFREIFGLILKKYGENFQKYLVKFFNVGDDNLKKEKKK